MKPVRNVRFLYGIGRKKNAQEGRHFRQNNKNEAQKNCEDIRQMPIRVFYNRLESKQCLMTNCMHSETNKHGWKQYVAIYVTYSSFLTQV